MNAALNSNTNTEGHAQKRTGAIYDVQAPSAFPSLPIGAWNTYEIRAYKMRCITLNNVEVNDLSDTRSNPAFSRSKLTDQNPP